MKNFWWLLGGVGLAVGGFVVGRQVTQNAVARQAALMAALAAKAAGVKPGTVIATPAGTGVVP